MKTVTASFIALALALISVNGVPTTPLPNSVTADTAQDNAKYTLVPNNDCAYYESKIMGDAVTITATCGKGGAAVVNELTLADGHLVRKDRCEYSSVTRGDGTVYYKEECPKDAVWTQENPVRKPECEYNSLTRGDGIVYYKEDCFRVFEFTLQAEKSDK